MTPKIVYQDFSKGFYSKRKREKEKLNFGVNSTFLLLLGIIVILLLYYIWISNTNATQGYNIMQFSADHSSLRKEIEILDLKLAEIQSFSKINSEENKKDMEKTEQSEHLVIKNNVQYVYNNN